MQEFLSQTAVQVAGILFATGVLSFVGWLLRSRGDQSKLRLYVYGLSTPCDVRQYLLDECAQAVADRLQEERAKLGKLLTAPEQNENGKQEISHELLGLFVRSALGQTTAFRSLRIEQQIVVNDADEPATASVQNLGQGTVFVTGEATEIQVFSGPFEITQQIPAGQSIEVYYISPNMKFDRLDSTTGLIVVRENGKILSVRNRRYDRESVAAGRYLPHKARARALFVTVDVVEAVFVIIVFFGSAFMLIHFGGKLLGLL